MGKIFFKYSWMNVYSQTMYMLIYSQIVKKKMKIAKWIPSTTPKKIPPPPLSNLGSTQHQRSRMARWGDVFFSVKLVPIKVIKLNQINKVNNIQVQACYRNGSQKTANNPLGGLMF